MRSFRFAGWAALVVFLGAVGCKVYDESMLLQADAGIVGSPAGKTENGTGWWSGRDPQSSCYSARMPSAADRPKNTTAGDVGALMFAIRTMRLGSRNPKGELDPAAWQGIGFDLDGLCTQSPTCPTVGEPPLSCKPTSAAIPADGTYCRDNNFGNLEYLITTNADIQARFRLSDPTFNCSICQGAYNMLFRVSGYNGLPDDSAVRVDIYPSPGLDELKTVDCTQDTWDTTACWDQSDPWQVQTNYVPSGISGDKIGDSTLYDPSAFVRGGYVIASLPANTEFWFPGTRGVAQAFPLILQGGIVTGALKKDSHGQWTIEDGMIAGRLKSTDAISAFQKIGMCKDDPLFMGAQLYAKTSADVLSSGDVVPESPCDAVSVGLAFTAGQASVGTLTDVAPLVPCETSDAGAADSAADN